MDESVKAVRIGDKVMLFIDGKRSTVSQKVAPEAFEKVVELIKNKDTKGIRNMFSGVNEKIKSYAKGIFTIKGNNVYATGSTEPAPKLVARKMFEMMQVEANPKPLDFLNKKMQRNGKGVAAGMEIFAKLDEIPMTTWGNLVLRVGVDEETINNTLRTQGVVVGNPLNANNRGGGIQHDLPVCDFAEREIYNFVYCLVDPSDILAFYNGNIRVGRYKILIDFKYEKTPVIKVPLEELYDISFSLWCENQKIKV